MCLYVQNIIYGSGNSHKNDHLMCTWEKRHREFQLRFGACFARCDWNRYIKPMRKDWRVSRNDSEMFVCICVMVVRHLLLSPLRSFQRTQITFTFIHSHRAFSRGVSSSMKHRIYHEVNLFRCGKSDVHVLGFVFGDQAHIFWTQQCHKSFPVSEKTHNHCHTIRFQWVTCIERIYIVSLSLTFHRTFWWTRKFLVIKTFTLLVAKNF